MRPSPPPAAAPVPGRRRRPAPARARRAGPSAGSTPRRRRAERLGGRDHGAPAKSPSASAGSSVLAEDRVQLVVRDLVAARRQTQIASVRSSIATRSSASLTPSELTSAVLSAKRSTSLDAGRVDEQRRTAGRRASSSRASSAASISPRRRRRGRPAWSVTGPRAAAARRPRAAVEPRAQEQGERRAAAVSGEGIARGRDRGSRRGDGQVIGARRCVARGRPRRVASRRAGPDGFRWRAAGSAARSSRSGGRPRRARGGGRPRSRPGRGSGRSCVARPASSPHRRVILRLAGTSSRTSPARR